eukprot:10783377-Alexandrium_andersonii.AAC.1
MFPLPSCCRYVLAAGAVGGAAISSPFHCTCRCLPAVACKLCAELPQPLRSFAVCPRRALRNARQLKAGR